MHCTNIDLLCIRPIKATAISYKVDVNRKLILQLKQKFVIENYRPKVESCK